jgi:hypothetical protein
MDGKPPKAVVIGSRAWSAFGFVLTFAPGILALWAGIYGWVYGDGVIRETIMAAAGLLMLVYAADNLVRTIRPNRFLLDDEGFELDSWRGTRRWSWHAYRGLRGVGHQALCVEDAEGRARIVAIGNWPRDLEHRLYAYASMRGARIEEPPRLRPSATPMLLLSSALIALALAVGVSATA